MRNEKRMLIAMFLAGATLSSPALYAAEGDEADAGPEDDATMAVVEEGQAPDASFRDLALPEDAAEEGVENSAEGLATANAAREEGRANASEASEASQEGRETARAAREQGRAFGEETAARAREEAGEAGRTADEALGDARETARDSVPENAAEEAGRATDNIPESVPSGPDM